MNFPEKSIQLSTGTHAYTEIGDAAETLLLLHGFAFRVGMYPLAQQLSSQFRLIIPDLPFSVKNDAFVQHNLPGYADFLLEFVRTLKLDRISIFGNSLGGTLALMCARIAPDLFKRLVIRSPLWSVAQLPWYLRIKPLNRLHLSLSKNRSYAIWALERFYQASARLSAVDKYAGDSIVPYQVEQISPRVLSRFLAELLDVEFTDALKGIHTETLIVWGEQDTFIPSTWGASLANLLPNACYLEMQGEYHNISTVDTAKLAEEINLFLSTM